MRTTAVLLLARGRVNDERLSQSSVPFQAVAPHPLLPRSPRRLPLRHIGHVPARLQPLRQGGHGRRSGFRGAEPVGRGRPAVCRAARSVGLDRRWDQELPLGTRQGLAQTARRSEYFSGDLITE